jgi:cytochrome c oxidase assembly protein subunit 15
VVLVVGVTGSLAALGDTLFPATSLGGALAEDFSAHSGWLVRWRWTHPVVAVVASAFLVWILLRAVRGPQLGPEDGPEHGMAWSRPRGLSALVLVLLTGVYLLGVLNVTLLAPVWTQVAHLLAADVLWVTLVVLTAWLTLAPAKAK